MKILKNHLIYQDQKTNVMYFLPENLLNSSEEIKPTFVLMTHGYTSDKSSILNWAIRLAEVGVSVALFDLPGHYLGNYSEVLSFDIFKLEAHKLYLEAFNGLKTAFKDEFGLTEHITPKNLKIAFTGHSMGAMLSLKAITMNEFEIYNKRAICVGLGMAPKEVLHLFDTPFYRATLDVREQLVSKALNSKNVFPWIRDEKNSISISNQDIHLISGLDDLVVGDDGMERFQESLILKSNRVTIEKPTRLPHHEPALAASHIKKYLKKIEWI
jgi:hypothetical protein